MANPININGVFQQEYIPVNFADYSGQQGGILEKLKLENDYLRNENELWKSKVRELEKKVQDQVLELKRKDVEIKNKDLELKAKQLEAYKRNANQNAFTSYGEQYGDNNQYAAAAAAAASCSKAIEPPIKLTKKGQPYKRANHNLNGNDITCTICSECFRTPAELRLHDIITHARKRVHDSMKRDWMTKNIRKKGAMDKDYYNTYINCKGCNKQFPARVEQKAKTNYTYYRLDYYVHCIEECSAYQALGLIKICKHCNLVFLSSQGLGIHHRTCK